MAADGQKPLVKFPKLYTIRCILPLVQQLRTIDNSLDFQEMEMCYGLGNCCCNNRNTREGA